VLALSYGLGAVCIVMIGLSENGLWLMALAIFGTGIGISGSQVGLVRNRYAVSHPKPRDRGELVKRGRPLRRHRPARSPAA
jgi:hypothetical protein